MRRYPNTGPNKTNRRLAVRRSGPATRLPHRGTGLTGDRGDATMVDMHRTGIPLIADLAIDLAYYASACCPS